MASASPMKSPMKGAGMKSKSSGKGKGGRADSKRLNRLGAILFACLIALAALYAVNNTWPILPFLAQETPFVLILALPLIILATYFLYQQPAGYSLFRERVAKVFIVVLLFTPLYYIILMWWMATPLLLTIVPLLTDNGVPAPLAILGAVPVAALALFFLLPRILSFDKIKGFGPNPLFTLIIASLAIIILSLLGTAIIIGISSAGAFESAKATMLFFLIVPISLNLLTYLNAALGYSPQNEIALMAIPFAYVIFPILGVILGAASFFLFG